MKAEDLIEAINIIAKYIPISEIKVWKEDHYMLGVTNKETVKFTIDHCTYEAKKGDLDEFLKKQKAVFFEFNYKSKFL